MLEDILIVIIIMVIVVYVTAFLMAWACQDDDWM